MNSGTITVRRILKELACLREQQSEMMQYIKQLAESLQAEERKPPELVWLDAQEVMQKLHMTARTLRRRRNDGTIRHTKIKGKYYYLEADITALLLDNYC